MDYAENTAACSSDSGEGWDLALQHENQKSTHCLATNFTHTETEKNLDLFFFFFTKVKGQNYILNGDLKCTKVHRFNVDQYTTVHNQYIDM